MVAPSSSMAVFFFSGEAGSIFADPTQGAT